MWYVYLFKNGGFEVYSIAKDFINDCATAGKLTEWQKLRAEPLLLAEKKPFKWQNVSSH
jgi:hypothetical protein